MATSAVRRVVVLAAVAALSTFGIRSAEAAESIDLLTPANGAAVGSPVTITWSGSGLTSAHPIQIQIGGTVVDTVPATTTSYVWTPAADGPTTIRLQWKSTKSATIAVLVDTTAPSIAETSRTEPNEHGWNDGDVEVTWACSDGGSGVDEETVTAVVTGEGEDLETTGTCTDLAGNTASATAGGIDIDRTAPAIAESARTEPNAHGWNDGDVEVTWSCTDGLSGVASDTVSATADGEGSDLDVTGTCTDLAGNEASATADGIAIDRTAPAIEETGRSPEPNEAGWNNTDVDVSWACSDALSGAVEAAFSGAVTGEGDDLDATGTCTDLAGNEASATATGVKIDRTAPTAAVAQPFLGVAIGAVSGTADDALSGVASVAVTFTHRVTGAATTHAAICLDGCATWVVTGVAPGAYDVTATATDVAGNVGEPSASVQLLVV